jgi:hypothetical protein
VIRDTDGRLTELRDSIHLHFKGQTHYIGPIRSITKWTAGAELDVRQALDQKSKQPSSENETGTTGEGSGDTSTVPRLYETAV